MHKTHRSHVEGPEDVTEVVVDDAGPEPFEDEPAEEEEHQAECVGQPSIGSVDWNVAVGGLGAHVRRSGQPLHERELDCRKHADDRPSDLRPEEVRPPRRPQGYEEPILVERAKELGERSVQLRVDVPKKHRDRGTQTDQESREQGTANECGEFSSQRRPLRRDALMRISGNRKPESGGKLPLVPGRPPLGERRKSKRPGRFFGSYQADGDSLSFSTKAPIAQRRA